MNGFDYASLFIKEAPEDVITTDFRKIKEIREELFSATQMVVNALKEQFNLLVYVTTTETSLNFALRIDPEKPEELTNILTLTRHVDSKQFGLTLLGGDYHPKVIYQLSNLIEQFNYYHITNIDVWYRQR